MTKSNLVGLAKEGIFAGLRFLQYFITISDSAKKEIVKVIESHLDEKPGLSDKELERYAEHAYIHLTYGVINAVIRKISKSVGSKEAMEIYALLEQDVQTPALSLIKQAIDLHFNKTINVTSIQRCSQALKDNLVCQRILKELVVQHLYMFPVGHKEKQKLSSMLGISLKGQKQMELNKRTKRIS